MYRLQFWVTREGNTSIRSTATSSKSSSSSSSSGGGDGGSSSSSSISSISSNENVHLNFEQSTAIHLTETAP